MSDDSFQKMKEHWLNYIEDCERKGYHCECPDGTKWVNKGYFWSEYTTKDQKTKEELLRHFILNNK